MLDLASQTIKGYQLRERLGTGGFGAVYRAFQPSVGREVAVKIILPDMANQPEFIRRFEAEAQVIARLEHQCIVPLYDYWRDPDGAFLVMRWLRGGSLQDLLKRGALDVDTISRILEQVAAALTLAHRSNIIHRDIKPGNILLDEDGNAYLADFGIAKDLQQTGNSGTQIDAIVGSLDYLSPEQARSEPVTPRTDIYSLGIVLYELLTGTHPFPRTSAIERLYKHINEPLMNITTLDDGIRDAVNVVIQKATAKNPQQRYESVSELATAFKEAAGLNRVASGSTLVELFTQREQEVLNLLVAGLTNPQIAEKLVVTVSTVKWYNNEIFRKLRVRSRVQAVVRARELNLVLSAGTAGADSSPQSVTNTLLEPENPYKGLRAFQAADERDFFGREEFIQKLLKRMTPLAAMTKGEDNARFLAVIGPSGSGKSSVVKAGLIPALLRGGVPGSDRWFVVEMLPGARPFDELEIALLKIAPGHVQLHDQLRRDEHGLLRAVQLLLPADNSELVILIDQFEEVFTLVEDESVRANFLKLLLAAVTDPRSRVRIIVTLRADFYDRPLNYPEFGELLRNHMETVLPLSAKGIERAIAEPARRAGIRFEEGLIATIVADVNYQAGALPLLQYALTELFEQRSARIITHEAYYAIGGAVGALAKRAEAIYQELTPEAQLLTCQMFLRLVTLGEGVEDTRRRTTRTELVAISPNPELLDEVIDTYADYRLLALDNDPSTRVPTVEVAHEALLREWERLRAWLNDSRQDIRLERQLAQSTDEWGAAGRDASYLLTGARLELFATWATNSLLALTPSEHAYLDASLKRRDREKQAETERRARETALEQRSVRFLRALVAVLLLATLGAFGLTGVAINQSNLTQQTLATSDANFQRAERIRLASQAQIALNQGEDERIPALLAIRSLEFDYSPEADAALLTALSRSSSKQSFVGHTDGLSTGDISPDGLYVLTASSDATARLWDVQTGSELRRFTGHSGLVYQVLFAPDGQSVWTSGSDGTVRQWDALTGEELAQPVRQGIPVYALALSPDGKSFVISNDLVAELWDIETRSMLRQFIGHTDTVNHTAFSADGRFLATGSYDTTVRLWDVGTGEELRVFEGSADCPCWVSFSPDGSQIASAGYDSSVRLWDVESGTQLRRFSGHTGQVLSVEFSPDGKQLVTAGGPDQTIRLWDVDTGQELRQLLGHTSVTVDADFSPDGRYVFSTSTDNTARLWDLNRTSEPRLFRNPLAAIHANAVVMAALSSDNRVVTTVNGNGMLQTWDVETFQVTHYFLTDNSGFIVDAALSPDGTILLTPGGDGFARLWRVSDGELLYAYPTSESPVISVKFSPDGEFFVTGSENGEVTLRGVHSGELRQRFVGHEGAVKSVAVSPDNGYVATAGNDGMVRVWELQTGTEVRRLEGHIGAVYSVAFSPDGTRILTGGDDNTARLWNTADGRQLRSFDGHILAIWRVAFSSDGRQAITASLDKSVRIWETDTGQVVRQFVGHRDTMRFVVMSFDGQFLLVGDSTSAYLWRVNLKEVVALACSHLTQDFTPGERARYDITDEREVCDRAAAVVATPVPVGAVAEPTGLPG